MSDFPIIPGETPIDISGLRAKGVTNRTQLNLVEAANIRIAAQKYLVAKPSRRKAPFDLPWTKRLHKEMLGKVWSWAGQFRTTNLNLGVSAPQVESSVQNMLDDLAFWNESQIPLLHQSAMLHHRAVQIHPFLNGNGRWARLLANIWLKRSDHAIVEWPEQTLGSDSIIRDAYLRAIKAADNADYSALIQLVTEYTPSTKS